MALTGVRTVLPCDADRRYVHVTVVIAHRYPSLRGSLTIRCDSPRRRPVVVPASSGGFPGELGLSVLREVSRARDVRRAASDDERDLLAIAQRDPGGVGKGLPAAVDVDGDARLRHAVRVHALWGERDVPLGEELTQRVVGPGRGLGVKDAGGGVSVQG